MSTTVQAAVEAPGDAQLISAVRAGDNDAYGELFLRHVEAAHRLGRQLVSAGDVDDLVSEAFAKVLTVLQRGEGPDLAFRAYLLTAVRRLHIDKVRTDKRLQPTDDLEPYDPGVPFRDTAVEGFESEVAAKAFASLPERWQMVLWHTEVEGLKPAAVAPLLGISPNSVSALSYRAREGLRQAFITCHASDVVDERCEWTRENLGAYIRSGIGPRESGRVKAHLEECRRCTAIYLELTEVNSNLRGVLAPLVLGGAAAAYLKGGGVIGLGSGGLGGAVAWLQNFVRQPVGVATAGAVVAAAAAGAFAMTSGSTPVPQADPPAAAAPAPAAGGGGGGGAGGDGGGGGAGGGPAAVAAPVAPAITLAPVPKGSGGDSKSKSTSKPAKKQGSSGDPGGQDAGPDKSAPKAPAVPDVSPKPLPEVDLAVLPDRVKQLIPGVWVVSGRVVDQLRTYAGDGGELLITSTKPIKSLNLGSCSGSGTTSVTCDLADRTSAFTLTLLSGATQKLTLTAVPGDRYDETRQATNVTSITIG